MVVVLGNLVLFRLSQLAAAAAYEVGFVGPVVLFPLFFAGTTSGAGGTPTEELGYGLVPIVLRPLERATEEEAVRDRTFPAYGKLKLQLRVAV